MNIRVGFGYDVHKLVAGRELWLGGIKLNYELGLLGHSDADVLIHVFGGLCPTRVAAALCRLLFDRAFGNRRRVFTSLGDILLRRLRLRFCLRPSLCLCRAAARFIISRAVLRRIVDVCRGNERRYECKTFNVHLVFPFPFFCPLFIFCRGIVCFVFLFFSLSYHFGSFYF